MNQLQRAINAQPCHVGRNLRLRQLSITDANEIVKLHQNPLMTRWLLDNVSFDNLQSVIAFSTRIRKFHRQHPGLGIWALDRYVCRYTREQLALQGALSIVTEETVNTLLNPVWQLQGWFNLTPVPDYPDQIELGARLHHSAWGQRIACLIGQQLVDYAFNVLSLQRLYLQCHPLNMPALYCAAYLGFDHPESVKTLGSEALKLSIAARENRCHDSCAGINDSQRRRNAVNRVCQWVDSTAAVTA